MDRQNIFDFFNTDSSAEESISTEVKQTTINGSNTNISKMKLLMPNKAKLTAGISPGALSLSPLKLNMTSTPLLSKLTPPLKSDITPDLKSQLSNSLKSKLSVKLQFPPETSPSTESKPQFSPTLRSTSAAEQKPQTLKSQSTSKIPTKTHTVDKLPNTKESTTKPEISQSHEDSETLKSPTSKCKLLASPKSVSKTLKSPLNLRSLKSVKTNKSVNSRTSKTPTKTLSSSTAAKSATPTPKSSSKTPTLTTSSHSLKSSSQTKTSSNEIPKLPQATKSQLSPTLRSCHKAKLNNTSQPKTLKSVHNKKSEHKENEKIKAILKLKKVKKKKTILKKADIVKSLVQQAKEADIDMFSSDSSANVKKSVKSKNKPKKVKTKNEIDKRDILRNVYRAMFYDSDEEETIDVKTDEKVDAQMEKPIEDVAKTEKVQESCDVINASGDNNCKVVESDILIETKQSITDIDTDNVKSIATEDVLHEADDMCTKQESDTTVDNVVSCEDGDKLTNQKLTDVKTQNEEYCDTVEDEISTQTISDETISEVATVKCDINSTEENSHKNMEPPDIDNAKASAETPTNIFDSFGQSSFETSINDDDCDRSDNKNNSHVDDSCKSDVKTDRKNSSELLNIFDRFEISPTTTPSSTEVPRKFTNVKLQGLFKNFKLPKIETCVKPDSKPNIDKSDDSTAKDTSLNIDKGVCVKPDANSNNDKCHDLTPTDTSLNIDKTVYDRTHGSRHLSSDSISDTEDIPLLMEILSDQKTVDDTCVNDTAPIIDQIDVVLSQLATDQSKLPLPVIKPCDFPEPFQAANQSGVLDSDDKAGTPSSTDNMFDNVNDIVAKLYESETFDDSNVDQSRQSSEVKVDWLNEAQPLNIVNESEDICDSDDSLLDELEIIDECYTSDSANTSKVEQDSFNFDDKLLSDTSKVEHDSSKIDDKYLSDINNITKEITSDDDDDDFENDLIIDESFGLKSDKSLTDIENISDNVLPNLDFVAISDISSHNTEDDPVKRNATENLSEKSVAPDIDLMSKPQSAECEWQNIKLKVTSVANTDTDDPLDKIDIDIPKTQSVETDKITNDNVICKVPPEISMNTTCDKTDNLNISNNEFISSSEEVTSKKEANVPSSTANKSAHINLVDISQYLSIYKGSKSSDESAKEDDNSVIIVGESIKTESDLMSMCSEISNFSQLSQKLADIKTEIIDNTIECKPDIKMELQENRVNIFEQMIVIEDDEPSGAKETIKTECLPREKHESGSNSFVPSLFTKPINLMSSKTSALADIIMKMKKHLGTDVPANLDESTKDGDDSLSIVSDEHSMLDEAAVDEDVGEDASETRRYDLSDSSDSSDDDNESLVSESSRESKKSMHSTDAVIPIEDTAKMTKAYVHLTKLNIVEEDSANVPKASDDSLNVPKASDDCANLPNETTHIDVLNNKTDAELYKIIVEDISDDESIGDDKIAISSSEDSETEEEIKSRNEEKIKLRPLTIKISPLKFDYGTSRYIWDKTKKLPTKSLTDIDASLPTDVETENSVIKKDIIQLISDMLDDIVSLRMGYTSSDAELYYDVDTEENMDYDEETEIETETDEMRQSFELQKEDKVINKMDEADATEQIDESTLKDMREDETAKTLSEMLDVIATEVELEEALSLKLSTAEVTDTINSEVPSINKLRKHYAKINAVTLDAHPILIKAELPSQTSQSAFASDELDKYLEDTTNLQLSKFITLASSRCKRIATEVKPKKEAKGPTFDDIDGMVFASFESEHLLKAHVKIEHQRSGISNYNLKRFCSLQKPKSNVPFRKGENDPASADAFARYCKLLNKRMRKIRMKKEPSLVKIPEKNTSIARKTSDITKIKGWKKKVKLYDGKAETSPKLHWKTEARIMRLNMKNEYGTLGFNLKRKRRKNPAYTRRKSARPVTSFNRKPMKIENLQNLVAGMADFRDTEGEIGHSRLNVFPDDDLYPEHSRPITPVQPPKPPSTKKTMEMPVITETHAKWALVPLVSRLKDTDIPKRADLKIKIRRQVCPKAGCRYGCVCHMVSPPPSLPGSVGPSRSASPSASPSHSIATSRSASVSQPGSPAHKGPSMDDIFNFDDDLDNTQDSVEDIPCGKEFCRLGCICESLSHAGEPRKRSHCLNDSCMLKCVCSEKADDGENGRFNLRDRSMKNVDASTRKALSLMFIDGQGKRRIRRPKKKMIIGEKGEYQIEQLCGRKREDQGYIVSRNLNPEMPEDPIPTTIKDLTSAKEPKTRKYMFKCRYKECCARLIPHFEYARRKKRLNFTQKKSLEAFAFEDDDHSCNENSRPGSAMSDIIGDEQINVSISDEENNLSFVDDHGNDVILSDITTHAKTTPHTQTTPHPQTTPHKHTPPHTHTPKDQHKRQRHSSQPGTDQSLALKPKLGRSMDGSDILEEQREKFRNIMENKVTSTIKMAAQTVLHESKQKPDRRKSDSDQLASLSIVQQIKNSTGQFVSIAGKVSQNHHVKDGSETLDMMKNVVDKGSNFGIIRIVDNKKTPLLDSQSKLQELLCSNIRYSEGITTGPANTQGIDISNTCITSNKTTSSVQSSSEPNTEENRISRVKEKSPPDSENIWKVHMVYVKKTAENNMENSYLIQIRSNCDWIRYRSRIIANIADSLKSNKWDRTRRITFHKYVLDILLNASSMVVPPEFTAKMDEKSVKVIVFVRESKTKSQPEPEESEASTNVKFAENCLSEVRQDFLDISSIKDNSNVTKKATGISGFGNITLVKNSPASTASISQSTPDMSTPLSAMSVSSSDVSTNSREKSFYVYKEAENAVRDIINTADQEAVQHIDLTQDAESADINTPQNIDAIDKPEDLTIDSVSEDENPITRSLNEDKNEDKTEDNTSDDEAEDSDDEKRSVDDIIDIMTNLDTEYTDAMTKLREEVTYVNAIHSYNKSPQKVTVPKHQSCKKGGKINPSALQKYKERCKNAAKMMQNKSYSHMQKHSESQKALKDESALVPREIPVKDRSHQHNSLERARRRDMKDAFHTLREHVCDKDSRSWEKDKYPKVVVLKMAREEIASLEKATMQIYWNLENERRKNEELTAKLNDLCDEMDIPRIEIKSTKKTAQSPEVFMGGGPQADDVHTKVKCKTKHLSGDHKHGAPSPSHITSKIEFDKSFVKPDDTPVFYKAIEAYEKDRITAYRNWRKINETLSEESVEKSLGKPEGIKLRFVKTPGSDRRYSVENSSPEIKKSPDVRKSLDEKNRPMDTIESSQSMSRDIEIEKEKSPAGKSCVYVVKRKLYDIEDNSGLMSTIGNKHVKLDDASSDMMKLVNLVRDNSKNLPNLASTGNNLKLDDASADSGMKLCNLVRDNSKNLPSLASTSARQICERLNMKEKLGITDENSRDDVTTPISVNSDDEIVIDDDDVLELNQSEVKSQVIASNDRHSPNTHTPPLYETNIADLINTHHINNVGNQAKYTSLLTGSTHSSLLNITNQTPVINSSCSQTNCNNLSTQSQNVSKSENSENNVLSNKANCDLSQNIDSRNEADNMDIGTPDVVSLSTSMTAVLTPEPNSDTEQLTINDTSYNVTPDLTTVTFNVTQDHSTITSNVIPDPTTSTSNNVTPDLTTVTSNNVTPNYATLTSNVTFNHTATTSSVTPDHTTLYADDTERPLVIDCPDADSPISRSSTSPSSDISMLAQQVMQTNNIASHPQSTTTVNRNMAATKNDVVSTCPNSTPMNLNTAPTTHSVAPTNLTFIYKQDPVMSSDWRKPLISGKSSKYDGPKAFNKRTSISTPSNGATTTQPSNIKQFVPVKPPAPNFVSLLPIRYQNIAAPTENLLGPVRPQLMAARLQVDHSTGKSFIYISTPLNQQPGKILLRPNTPVASNKQMPTPRIQTTKVSSSHPSTVFRHKTSVVPNQQSATLQTVSPKDPMQVIHQLSQLSSTSQPLRSNYPIPSSSPTRTISELSTPVSLEDPVQVDQLAQPSSISQSLTLPRSTPVVPSSQQSPTVSEPNTPVSVNEPTWMYNVPVSVAQPPKPPASVSASPSPPPPPTPTAPVTTAEPTWMYEVPVSVAQPPKPPASVSISEPTPPLPTPTPPVTTAPVTTAPVTTRQLPTLFRHNPVSSTSENAKITERNHDKAELIHSMPQLKRRPETVQTSHTSVERTVSDLTTEYIEKTKQIILTQNPETMHRIVKEPPFVPLNTKMSVPSGLPQTLQTSQFSDRLSSHELLSSENKKFETTTVLDSTTGLLQTVEVECIPEPEIPIWKKKKKKKKNRTVLDTETIEELENRIRKKKKKLKRLEDATLYDSAGLPQTVDSSQMPEGAEFRVRKKTKKQKQLQDTTPHTVQAMPELVVRKKKRKKESVILPTILDSAQVLDAMQTEGPVPKKKRKYRRKFESMGLTQSELAAFKREKKHTKLEKIPDTVQTEGPVPKKKRKYRRKFELMGMTKSEFAAFKREKKHTKLEKISDTVLTEGLVPKKKRKYLINTKLEKISALESAVSSETIKTSNLSNVPFETMNNPVYVNVDADTSSTNIPVPILPSSLYQSIYANTGSTINEHNMNTGSTINQQNIPTCVENPDFSDISDNSANASPRHVLPISFNTDNEDPDVSATSAIVAHDTMPIYPYTDTLIQSLSSTKILPGNDTGHSKVPIVPTIMTSHTHDMDIEHSDTTETFAERQQATILSPTRFVQRMSSMTSEEHPTEAANSFVIDSHHPNTPFATSSKQYPDTGHYITTQEQHFVDAHSHELTSQTQQFVEPQRFMPTQETFLTERHSSSNVSDSRNSYPLTDRPFMHPPSPSAMAAILNFVDETIANTPIKLPYSTTPDAHVGRNFNPTRMTPLPEASIHRIAELYHTSPRKRLSENVIETPSDQPNARIAELFHPSPWRNFHANLPVENVTDSDADYDSDPDATNARLAELFHTSPRKHFTNDPPTTHFMEQQGVNSQNSDIPEVFHTSPRKNSNEMPPQVFHTSPRKNSTEISPISHRIETPDAESPNARRVDHFHVSPRRISMEHSSVDHFAENPPTSTENHPGRNFTENPLCVNRQLENPLTTHQPHCTENSPNTHYTVSPRRISIEHPSVAHFAENPPTSHYTENPQNINFTENLQIAPPVNPHVENPPTTHRTENSSTTRFTENPPTDPCANRQLENPLTTHQPHRTENFTTTHFTENLPTGNQTGTKPSVMSPLEEADNTLSILSTTDIDNTLSLPELTFDSTLDGSMEGVMLLDDGDDDADNHSDLDSDEDLTALCHIDLDNR